MSNQSVKRDWWGVAYWCPTHQTSHTARDLVNEHASEDRSRVEPRARSLVCSIGKHDKCDGHVPEGHPEPCACRCHEVEDRSRVEGLDVDALLTDLAMVNVADDRSAELLTRVHAALAKVEPDHTEGVQGE